MPSPKAKYKEPVEVTKEDLLAPPVSSEQRSQALSLIGVNPQDPRTLEQKLGVTYDNTAMLGDSPNKKKKLTTSDRISAVFKQYNFSPTTDLVLLAKVERAKLEAYNRAVDMNLAPELIDALPQPDKKFYASLCMQLSKFETPELKSIEVTAEIQHGMTVQVIHTAPQQKVIRTDAGTPAKLKALFGQTVDNTLTIMEKATAVEVNALDD